MKKVSIVFILFLSGCKTTWYKPNATLAEFNQDKYQCMQESAATFGTNLTQTSAGKNSVTFDANAGNRAILFQNCMEAHGYSRQHY